MVQTTSVKEHFTSRATEASSCAVLIRVKPLESKGPTTSEMMGPPLEVKYPRLLKRLIQFCGKILGQLRQWGGENGEPGGDLARVLNGICTYQRVDKAPKKPLMF